MSIRTTPQPLFIEAANPSRARHIVLRGSPQPPDQRKYPVGLGVISHLAAANRRRRHTHLPRQRCPRQITPPPSQIDISKQHRKVEQFDDHQPRNVVNDIEVLSGSGVPVYATRGPRGGFELLDTFAQAVPALPPGLTPGTGPLRRVRVRIAPVALEMALLTGRPEGWRPRPNADPTADRPDWIEGSFRFDSYDTALRELVALGSEVEVLLPEEMRHTMAEIGCRIAGLHRPDQPWTSR